MKTVLITGANRGIGAAIAQRFVGPNIRLLLVVRQENQQISDMVLSAQRCGGEAKVLHCDIRNVEAIASVIEPMLSDGIDVLINNAGMTKDGLALRLKDEDYQQVFATNFFAAVRLTRLCLPLMIKKKYGRIVQLSSLAAKYGNAGQSAYAAAKAALEAHTRSLAKEVASRNITVNAVAPGFIDTDMTTTLSADFRARLEHEIPLRRFGRAEEVAEVVHFLASDEASYVSGQVVEVAGGLLG